MHPADCIQDGRRGVGEVKGDPNALAVDNPPHAQRQLREDVLDLVGSCPSSISNFSNSQIVLVASFLGCFFFWVPFLAFSFLIFASIAIC